MTPAAAGCTLLNYFIISVTCCYLSKKKQYNFNASQEQQQCRPNSLEYTGIYQVSNLTYSISEIWHWTKIFFFLAILSDTKYFNLFNIAMFAFLITVYFLYVYSLPNILQKSCIDFAINATPLERYMPEERVGFKYRLWRIVESTPFEYFIMTLIVLNTILLMMKVCAVLFFSSI